MLLQNAHSERKKILLSAKYLMATVKSLNILYKWKSTLKIVILLLLLIFNHNSVRYSCYTEHVFVTDHLIVLSDAYVLKKTVDVTNCIIMTCENN